MTFTGKVASITVALGTMVLLTAGSGLYTSSSLQHSFAGIISGEARAQSWEVPSMPLRLTPQWESAE